MASMLGIRIRIARNALPWPPIASLIAAYTSPAPRLSHSPRPNPATTGTIETTNINAVRFFHTRLLANIHPRITNGTSNANAEPQFVE